MHVLLFMEMPGSLRHINFGVNSVSKHMIALAYLCIISSVTGWSARPTRSAVFSARGRPLGSAEVVVLSTHNYLLPFLQWEVAQHLPGEVKVGQMWRGLC